jgi:hypothetical protein
MPIKNWRFNRNPDKVRCREIARQIQIKPIETVFYLAKNEYDEKNDMYEILDGIHRYTALKMLPVDYITGVTTSYILLNIRYNATEGELVDFFKDLNKSIPVPDLYLQNPDQAKRDVINAIVDKWIINYSVHFSLSRKFQRPNMNRTVFTDILNDLYEKYKELLLDSHELEEQLLQYNELIRQQFQNETVPKTAIEKCKRSGLWLFMIGYDELVEKI